MGFFSNFLTVPFLFCQKRFLKEKILRKNNLLRNFKKNLKILHRIDFFRFFYLSERSNVSNSSESGTRKILLIYKKAKRIHSFGFFINPIRKNYAAFTAFLACLPVEESKPNFCSTSQITFKAAKACSPSTRGVASPLTHLIKCINSANNG